MLAVDFMDLRAGLNQLEAEINDAIADVRAYRDIAYAFLPTQSLKDLVENSVDARLNAFDAKVMQLFDQAEAIVDGSDTLQNELSELSALSGGQFTFNGFTETPNAFEFNVQVTPQQTATSFPVPTEFEIFGIDFSVGALNGFEVAGGLSLDARLRIEEALADPDVFLVPRGGNNELLRGGVSFTVDFGGDGYDLSPTAPTGMKTIATGNKIGGVLDYQGAIDFVFSPSFELVSRGTNVSNVPIANLPEPEITASDLKLEVPVAFQLMVDALPDFDYRTVFEISESGVSEQSNSQRIRIGEIEVFRNGNLVARGDFINQILVQGGFDLIDKIAESIDPELATVLLGNKTVFGDVTLDDLLFTEIWENPGIFEVESDPGTPFSPLDHLQVLGVPRIAVDIGEFLLQVAASKGSVQSDSSQIEGNQDQYGISFPIVDDSPAQSLLRILRKEPVKLVQFEYDYVESALREKGGQSALDAALASGAVVDTGVGHRAEVDIDTDRIKEEFKRIVSDKLGIGGKAREVIDRLIDEAFDNFSGRLKLALQAGVRAGLDTTFIAQLQAGDAVKPLDSFFIDTRVPLADFSFDVALEVSASTEDLIPFGAISGSGSSLTELAAGEASLPLDRPASVSIGGVVETVVNTVVDGGSKIVGGLSDGAEAIGEIARDLLELVETSLTVGLGVDGFLRSGFKPTASNEIRGDELLNILSRVFVSANLGGSVSVDAKLLGIELPSINLGGDILDLKIGPNGPMVNGQGAGMNAFAERRGNQIRVYGSTAEDDFTLGYDAGEDEILVSLGGATQAFDRAGVSRVIFDLRGTFAGQEGPTIAANRVANGGNDSVILLSSLNEMDRLVPVDIRGGSGNDYFSAYDTSGTYYNGNIIIRGGSGDDEIIAGAGQSRLNGERGDDTLEAGPGPSYLDGGDDNDTLRGMQDVRGDQPSFAGGRMIGGSGQDVLAVGQLSRGDFVLIGGKVGAGSEGSNLIAGGFGNDRIFAGNVTSLSSLTPIFDSGAASLLVGGPGDDIIHGSGGDDFLLGGWLNSSTPSGRDSLFAGGGDDLLIATNANLATNEFGLEPTDILDPSLPQTLPNIASGQGDNDTILVGQGILPVLVFGGDGDDFLQIGFGTLQDIRGGIGASMGTGNDDILLDDEGNVDNVDYVVTPTFFDSFSNTNLLPGEDLRRFGFLVYNGETESLTLRGSDAPNTFDVSPSVDTEYLIDGNLPAPGTVPSVLGDFLKLNTDGTDGRKISFNPPKSGNGKWTFTSEHQDVVFESIENFNHVERLAVAGEAARDGSPLVRVYDAETLEFLFEFMPYDADYRDGVRVATGDVDEDGIPDIAVAPGRLAEPLVKIYDGLGPEALLPATVAFQPPVLVGDYDGNAIVDRADYQLWRESYGSTTELAADGNANGIVDAGDYTLWRDNLGEVSLPPIAPLNTSDDYLLAEFLAYGPNFIDGMTIAVGDVTGDFSKDVVVVPSRGTSEVRVFENVGFADSFMPFDAFLAYDANFIGGATVAVGDLNGDGRGDIVTSTGSGSFVNVRVFDGNNLQTPFNGTPVEDFFAFDNTARGGSFVAVGNVIGDATPDIILGGGPYSGSRVQVFSGSMLPLPGTQFAVPQLEYIPNITAPENDRSPIRVAVYDHDKDGVADTIFSAQGPDGESQWLREYDPLDGSVVDAIFEDDPEFLNGFWIG